MKDLREKKPIYLYNTLIIEGVDRTVYTLENPRPIINIDTGLDCVVLIRHLVKEQDINYIYIDDNFDSILYKTVYELMRDPGLLPDPLTYTYLIKDTGQFISLQIWHEKIKILEFRSLELLCKKAPTRESLISAINVFTWTLGVTASATCMNEYKMWEWFDVKEYFWALPRLNKIPMVDTDNKDEIASSTVEDFCRDSYNGGYINYFCKLRKVYKNVTVFDCNSLYPYVMRKTTLPFGKPIQKVVSYGKFGIQFPEYLFKNNTMQALNSCKVQGLGEEWKTVEEEDENPFCDGLGLRPWERVIQGDTCYIITKKIRINPYSYHYVFLSIELLWAELRKDGVKCMKFTASSKGHTDTKQYDDKYLCKQALPMTLTQDDFILLIENYKCSFRFTGCCVFMAYNDMFNIYVDKFWNWKTGTDPDKRLYGKIMLNAISGRMGSPYKRQNGILNLSEDESGLVLNYEEQDIKTTWGSVAVASAITSRGKHITVDIIRKNRNRVLYSDTDSVHVLGSTIPDGIEVDPVEMGKWKIEHKFKEVIYLDRKKYIGEENNGYKITMAGVETGTQDDIETLVNSTGLEYLENNTLTVMQTVEVNGHKMEYPLEI